LYIIKNDCFALPRQVVTRRILKAEFKPNLFGLPVFDVVLDRPELQETAYLDVCAHRPAPLSSINAGAFQHTLSDVVELSGIGIHSGKEVMLSLHPAPKDKGIVFVRTDCAGALIPALYSNVTRTELCTTIGEKETGQVSTIEHLMAALSAFGIDNAYVHINGAETPIMDGSAKDFVALIEKGGIVQQSERRKIIRVRNAVEIRDNGRRVSLSPSDERSFDVTFINSRAGKPQEQQCKFVLSPQGFKREIANAPTFGFVSDWEMLLARNLAKGVKVDGDGENVIRVRDNGDIENRGKLEGVGQNPLARHKLLDAIGDLALAGGLLLAAYEGYGAGHGLNNMILRKLFGDSSNYELVYAAPAITTQKYHQEFALA
jgi:UDP-3-O-[3-hydroxymyristoyl] N-acetylglucosamine deacetylase